MATNRSVNIYINSNKALENLQKLEKELLENKNALSKLASEGKKGSKDFQLLSAEGKRLSETIKNQTSLLNINKLTLKELGDYRNKLKNTLKKTTPDTKEWQEHNKQIQAINIRYSQLSNTVSKSDCGISAVAKTTNRYLATLSSFIFVGKRAIDQIINLTTEYLKLDDALVSVRKRTGQTDEEVQELNNSLNGIQTRTSKEELLKLAEAAGQLGYTSNKDILPFVKVADRLRLVFSELGDEGVKNIAELSKAFGLTEELGVENAFDNIGSAISDLDDKTLATAPKLIDFTSVMSGVAKQANISVSDMLGYGATLEQLGQDPGKGAAALQKFILLMFKEPAKFAKIAGMEVGKFKDLLSTDANEAIKTILRTLNQNGGLQQLAPILKEMGVDGSRTVGVFASLAENVDLLEDSQRLANDAFAKGTSLTEEYNLSNENAAARADMRKKELLALREEFGKGLIPILEAAQNSTILFGKALVYTGKYILDNWKSIGVLTGAYIAYVAIKNKALLIDKAKLVLSKAKTVWMTAEVIGMNLLSLAQAKYTGNTIAATTATRVLTETMKANPILRIIGLVGLLGGAFFGLKSFIGDSSKEMSRLEKAMQGADAKVDAEKSKIQALTSVIHDNTASLELRRQKIAELKAIIPAYNAEISEEGRIINENTSAIDQYLIAKEKEIRFRAAEEELVKAFRDKRTQEKIVSSSQRGFDNKESHSKEVSQSAFYSPEVRLSASTDLIRASNKLEKEKAKLKKIESDIKELGIEMNTNDISPKKTNPDTTNNIDLDDDDKKDKKLESLQKFVDEQQKLLNDSYQKLREAQMSADELDIENINKKYDNDIIAITKREMEVQALREKLKGEGKWTKDNETEYQDFNATVQPSLVNNEKNREFEINKTLISQEEKRIDLQAKFAEKYLSPNQDKNKYDELEFSKQKELDGLDNDAANKQGLVSAEEYESAKAAIEDKYRQEKEKLDQESLQKQLDITKEGLSGMQGMLGSFSDIVGGMKDMELMDVEAAYEEEKASYDQMLKNKTISQSEYDEKVSALDEKRVEEQKAIQKKYADAEFALKVSQIIVATALSAMQAYASMSSIPLAGPVLGGIAAGVAVAAGAVQIGIAKKEHEKAKGYKVGGFTSEGNPSDVAGFVHKNEYVVPAWVLRTPKGVNYVSALEAIRTNKTAGWFGGGFTSPTSTTNITNVENSTEVSSSGDMIDLLRRLNAKLDGVSLLVLKNKLDKLESDNNWLKDHFGIGR